MVMNDARLDLVFAALSHATRRGLLARLAAGEQNITTLAADYNVSQPAISKHIGVLERAGLISSERRGREHVLRIVPGPAQDAQGWIAYYTQFWLQHFNAVDELIARRKEQPREP